jgi:hypothetical protein
MSVSVKVILLVGHDKTLYIAIEFWKLLGFTSVSTERWTLTLPKFDEPFGIRFHFKRFFFFGNRCR